MTRIGILLLFVFSLVFLVACSERHQVTVVYDDPVGAEYEMLKGSGILEETAALLNDRLKDPPELTLRAASCGAPNARYSPSAHEVLICYELLSMNARSFNTSEFNRENLTTDAVYLILYHEVGHALVDAYTLPITGREEDAVDQLAVAVFARNDMKDALYASAVLFKTRADAGLSFDASNEHAMDEQRYYNVLCWVYGSDPVKYAPIVEKGYLPQTRASKCEFEYFQMERSWKTLLGPYMKT